MVEEAQTPYPQNPELLNLLRCNSFKVWGFGFKVPDFRCGIHGLRGQAAQLAWAPKLSLRPMPSSSQLSTVLRTSVRSLTANISKYTYIYTYTCTYRYEYIRIYIYTHIHADTYVCICIEAYIHTCNVITMQHRSQAPYYILQPG